MQSNSTKRCTKCGEQKPIENFYLSSMRPTGRRYHISRCKQCTTKDSQEAYGKPEVLARVKDLHFQRQYGIDRTAYDAMFSAQRGKCAICGEAETRVVPRTGAIRLLAVDHDHSTGAVRQLLCSNCNRALGWFRDDLSLLKAATAYLERHRIRDNQEG